MAFLVMQRNVRGETLETRLFLPDAMLSLDRFILERVIPNKSTIEDDFFKNRLD